MLFTNHSFDYVSKSYENGDFSRSGRRGHVLRTSVVCIFIFYVAYIFSCGHSCLLEALLQAQGLLRSGSEG